MKFPRLGFTALLGALACSEPAAAPIYNTCTSDRDCSQGARCSSAFSNPQETSPARLCISELATVPYQVRILVSRLPAGVGRVDRFAFAPYEVSRSRTDYDLDVPKGIRVLGKVSGEIGSKVTPLNAEVAFAPVAESAQTARVQALVTESHGYTEPTEDNLVADLAANTLYNVRIIPLGSRSALFPPTSRVLDTSSGEPLEVNYADLEVLEGVLTDEAGRPQAGVNVRLVQSTGQGEEQEVGPVVSVTDTVGEDGSFFLRVPAAVLEARSYLLQVNLDPEDPWQTTVQLDPTRVDLTDGDAIIIPAVPKRVTFTGRIEKGDQPIAAELTFVSDFKPPQTAGDVHDRDWCNTSVPEDTRPLPKCRTTVRTATDSAGRFSVPLLPGDYKLYVSPGNDPNTSRRAQVAIHEAIIETQPGDGPQQGQVFRVSSNTAYHGYVRNQRGEPLAGVVVRAVALQAQGTLEDKTAPYNRSAETVTDEDGSFELGLDVGYYDLVARAGDGFPWVYATNLKIYQEDEVPGFVIPAPLVLAGTLRNAGTEAGSAAIEAYGEVTSLKGGKRLVLLGRTTSNEDGSYKLTLPPEIVDVAASPPDERTSKAPSQISR